MTQSLIAEQIYENNLHLCFELDDKTYAINAHSVMQVAMLPSLSTPQKLPDNIVGILNYNSMLINVIDVRKLLNLPTKPYSAANQMIIVKGEESLLAFIADKVSDFFHAIPNQLNSTSLDIFQSFVKSFYQKDENIINILNIASLESVIKQSKDTEATVNYAELFPSDDYTREILDKRSRQIALKRSHYLNTDFFGKDQYIIFNINKHMFCISSEYVKELISIKNFRITKMPYTPKYIKGIINLKGDFYTVMSLKEYITFDDLEDKTEEKIIVLEYKDIKLALLVDEIVDFINLSKEQIHNKNNIKLDSLYIKAEIYHENKVFNLLNVDKILDDKKLYIE